jgi:pyruvate formate lyase activating enzyme
MCVKACPQKAVSRNENGIGFNRPNCKLSYGKQLSEGKQACGICAKECPAAAIEVKGAAMDVEKLASELAKDKAYFGAEGGVTLSGGEALIQHEAVLELARLLKTEGLHIALDTAGCYDFHLLETLLPCIDLVLYDIKIFDYETHKRLIGAGNDLILENYKRLIEHEVGVWVRTPIIEGATDSEKNIAGIGNFIAECAAGRYSRLPEKWELCAFNNLCRDKYVRLDRQWAYRDTGLTDKTHIEKLTAVAARYIPGAVYTGTVKETNHDDIQK